MQIHITFRGHSKNTLALPLIICIYKRVGLCSLVLTGLHSFLYNVEIRCAAAVFTVAALALDVSGTF